MWGDEPSSHPANHGGPDLGVDFPVDGWLPHAALAFLMKMIATATFVLTAIKPGQKPRQIRIYGEDSAVIEMARFWRADGWDVDVKRDFLPWNDWQKDSGSVQ